MAQWQSEFAGLKVRRQSVSRFGGANLGAYILLFLSTFTLHLSTQSHVYKCRGRHLTDASDTIVSSELNTFPLWLHYGVSLVFFFPSTLYNKRNTGLCRILASSANLQTPTRTIPAESRSGGGFVIRCILDSAVEKTWHGARSFICAPSAYINTQPRNRR